jgi:hypothetical protein
MSALAGRMRILGRLRWRLQDGKKFEELLVELRLWNSKLTRFCPEVAAEVLLTYRMLLGLNSQDNRGTLMASAQSVETQIRQTQDPSAKTSLELLRDMAKIKADAEYFNSKPLDNQETLELVRFKKEMFNDRQSLDDSANLSAIGYLKTPTHRRPVYVEFKPYKEDDGTKSVEKRDAAIKLGRLMTVDKAADRLNMLKCLGLFKDSDRGLIGFVFKHPDDVNTGNTRLDKHKPYRLQKLLGDHNWELGWRFRLAKRVVESVIRLHVCGWLHKNIRSEPVVFFPKRDNKG